MTAITTFKASALRRKPLWECMKNYNVGDRTAEWPNNMISTKTVVYANGTIARKDDPVTFNVQSDELSLCDELSQRAVEDNPHVDFDFGSEMSSPVWPFFIAASASARLPKRITSKHIRNWFGGTIFPPSTITVEPLKSKGIWWEELVRDRSTPTEPIEPLLEPYYALIDWFQHRDEFVTVAFVRIGDRSHLADLDPKEYPEGTVLTPSVLPRMALGLTANGSVAGLFSYTVQT